MKLSPLLWIGFLSLFFGSLAYGLGGVEQSTYGHCSPTVNNTEGSVSINCPGLSEKDLNRIVTAFNETLQGFDGLKKTDVLITLLDEQVEKVQNHEQTISGLEGVIQKQAEIIKEILSDDSIGGQVRSLIANGDIKAAEGLVDKNTELLEQEDKQLAAKHYERGQVKELRLNYTDARTSFEKAAILQPRNSTYLNAAGNINNDLGYYLKAIDFYTQALVRDLKTFGVDHPNVARDHNNLGTAWYAKGEYDKAIEYHEQALVSNLKTFGGGLPDVAIRRNNLGMAWHAKGEYNKAVEYYEKALVTLEQGLGLYHPMTKTVTNNLTQARNASK